MMETQHNKDEYLITVYNPNGSTHCRHTDQCPGCRRCKDDMDKRFASLPQEERIAFHTKNITNPVLYHKLIGNNFPYKRIYRRQNGQEVPVNEALTEIFSRPCYICGWTLGLKRTSSMTLANDIDVFTCEWCNDSRIHW